jgi:DHA2 family multidrug resistance protein-like MFS transporter
MSRQHAHDTPGLRAWLGLLVILGPVLLVSMDGSILFLAMPRIGQALTPTADQALWILDVYGFAVGSLLIAFGNVGDRHGRLRLLMIGAGFAIGPILGGVLLERFWWGSVFLINLPVIAVFLAFAPTLLREVRAPRRGRIDALSVVTSAVGLMLTIYGVKLAAAEGLSVVATLAGIAGLVLLMWFARRQRHLKHPLMEFSLFRDRVFRVAIITGLLPLAAWSAAAYLAGVYLQSVLDLPVRYAALLALPGAVVLTITCIVTPVVVDRIGKRTALIVCHICIAAGLLFLLPTSITGGIGWYIASTAIAGVGYGISFAVVADTAVGAVPSERAGSASAIAETSNEIGNALGIALLGSLAALVFRLSGPDLAPTLDETLHLPDLVPAMAEEAKTAFVTGLHAAAAAASLLHMALGILALRWIPRSVTAQSNPDTASEDTTDRAESASR